MTVGRHETRVEFRDRDPLTRTLRRNERGRCMPSGSGPAGDPGSAPRTVEVVFESRETRTATPRILPLPAGQPERTEAGQADRCAGPGCGKVLERRATGRPARYCSARCRQAARRKSLRAQGKAALRVTKPVSKPRSAWEARETGAAAPTERGARRPAPGADTPPCPRAAAHAPSGKGIIGHAGDARAAGRRRRRAGRAAAGLASGLTSVNSVVCHPFAPHRPLR